MNDPKVKPMIDAIMAIVTSAPARGIDALELRAEVDAIIRGEVGGIIAPMEHALGLAQGLAERLTIRLANAEQEAQKAKVKTGRWMEVGPLHKVTAPDPPIWALDLIVRATKIHPPVVEEDVEGIVASARHLVELTTKTGGK